VLTVKRTRHEEILNLIEKNIVTTQEDLLALLKESGFNVTQATVSRDIKELRLVKTMDSDNNYRYTTISAGGENITPKFADIFASSVISIDYAVNDVVIRCYTGMANAACMALDSMNWQDIVGTLAGDDTIFVVTRNETAAERLTEKLSGLL
jgi:transcriptional regulator of arginine metabolism